MDIVTGDEIAGAGPTDWPTGSRTDCMRATWPATSPPPPSTVELGLDGNRGVVCVDTSAATKG